jgi:hypothetical protein
LQDIHQAIDRDMGQTELGVGFESSCTRNEQVLGVCDHCSPPGCYQHTHLGLAPQVSASTFLQGSCFTPHCATCATRRLDLARRGLVYTSQGMGTKCRFRPGLCAVACLSLVCFLSLVSAQVREWERRTQDVTGAPDVSSNSRSGCRPCFTS